MAWWNNTVDRLVPSTLLLLLNMLLVLDRMMGQDVLNVSSFC